jgi:TolB-like protein/tetratricopeptide (TPR) repeat protein
MDSASLGLPATLGHYRIVDKIGAGGMGEVYRAHDERLARDVAIKVLPPGTLIDESDRKHFHKEALVLSKLNHPNIATIYDFDTQQEVDFLVMEYIPGITLSEKLATRPLPEKEVITLGTQLAEGLAAAHEQGVVHRDLKPGNLRVTTDGRLKILDFGLAKLRGPVTDGATTESLSETKVMAGTLPYMAPEQLLDGKLDARADIWAAGCVLYEMATGRRPFVGSGAALIEAILHQHPVAPSKIKHKVAPALEAIILKCLEKDPALRYASARDIAVDLHRLGAGTVTEALAARKQARVVKIGAIAVLLLVVAAAALWYWTYRHKVAFSGRPKVMAVLYFKNMSQDATLNWLDGGLTEMLTTNLGQIEGIEVLSTERIMMIRKRLKHKPDAELTAETAPEVAREAGADAFVTGALIRLGPTRLRVDVRLQDATTGRLLFSDKVESADVNGIFGMVDAMTSRLSERSLPWSQLPGKAPMIEEAATSNVEAYRHFQVANDYFTRMLLTDAIRENEEAVRLDPQFALAYLALFSAYRSLGDAGRALEFLGAAERLQHRLPQLEQLILAAWKARLAGDIKGLIRAREAVLRKAPRNSGFRYYLADALVIDEQATRAVAVMREGLALDPKDVSLWGQLPYIEYYAGHETAALEACDRYQALAGPKEPDPWSTRGDLLYAFGHSDEAAAAYRKVLELKPEYGEYRAVLYLALLHSDSGQYVLAEQELKRYRQHVSGVWRVDAAVFDAQLRQSRGDPEGALAIYRDAISDLIRAGQPFMAEATLRVFAAIAGSVGQEAVALRFARQQNLHGRELLVFSLLQAAAGNETAAEQALREYSAPNRETSSLGAEQERAVNAIRAALARQDPRATSEALRTLPIPLHNPRELGRMEVFVRGRARLLVQDYIGAEADFRDSLRFQRMLGAYRGARSRAPLIEHLCCFYLGQVYEATARPSDAVREYRSFLSHYSQSRSLLPQIGQARAALKRLGE